MRAFRFPIAMLAILFVASGCASIVSHSHWPVTINSSPSGATVTIKNKRRLEMHKGVTPMTITLSSKAGFFSPAKYQLSFEKEGYLPSTTSLSAGLNGWYIGNIVFGGLIGLLIVDPATGAMWRLSETTYGTLSPDPDKSPDSTSKGEATVPSSPQPDTGTDVDPPKPK